MLHDPIEGCGEKRRVAVVLPPREGFGPARAGAIGLVVRLLAQNSGRFAGEVIGPRQENPVFAGIPFREAGGGWAFLGRYGAYQQAVRRLMAADPPVLIEVHNRPALALVLAARLAPTPVVLFLHNDPLGMREARAPLRRKALLEKLTGIVSVSSWLDRRFCDGLEAPAAKTAILPNPIALAELPPFTPPDERERLILFAGRTVADKGADLFVAACREVLPRLKGWRAALIGADRFGFQSPDTPYVRRLKAEAAEAGIEWAGYRPHDEVLAAMARAAIVIVPSRWPEPFGLTALEAMACGAALIASPRGALPELAGSAALYIEPEPAGELAAAVAALAADPQQRALLGEAGRARAGAFDQKLISARLDALREEWLAR